ncbi:MULTISPECIES: ABC transporter permease [unclassified Roseitalea]|uniref:ABC transporter permease n=1 Tax=unclassified Roseitalea TaxID=2639107 RepID=UPI00273F7C24|nr:MULTISPECIES: ABC transporter permease [unclassified Roseitalea]
MIALVEQVLASTMILTTPILLAAIGGLVNRQGGIVNIALEAKMIAGAFIAVIACAATGSWLAGVGAAAIAGAFVGWLFSLAITRARANMIIAGLGLNVLIAGLVGLTMSVAYGTSGTLRLEGVELLPKVLPETVETVPVIGRALAALDPLTVFAWAVVAVLPFLLANTRLGLRLRAAGNAPQVARAMGLRAKALQDFGTTFAGLFSGLAGAHLALASLGLFNEGLTAGRGFIALAAFYFARNHPVGTALVCLLFGFLDASQIRLQTAGLPPTLIGTLPYVMVIVGLVITALNIRRRQATA